MELNIELTDPRLNAYRRMLEFKSGRAAFVAVLPQDRLPRINGALGVAIANETGYMPVPLAWVRFASFSDAEVEADRLNTLVGLDDETAMRIVFSTMGGQRYYATQAEEVK